MGVSNVASVRFRLALSQVQLLKHYRGAAAQVHVRSLDGQQVQFPAQQLRQFVSHNGVAGLFELRFGPDHKLIELRRVAD